MTMQQIIVFTLLTTNIFCACNDKVANDTKEGIIFKSDTTKQQKMNFKETIDTIEKRVVDLTAAVDLFNVKEFINLFESPELYKSDALNFLSTDSNSTQQKMIAIYAMQKLPANEYINFFIRMTSMYLNDSLADDYLLLLVIAADFSSGSPIIRNYDNNEVVIALNKIKSDRKTSDNLKKWIDKILSGKSWKKMEERRRDNG